MCKEVASSKKNEFKARVQKSVPYLWPQWRKNGYNRYPIYDQNGWKTIPLGPHIAHMGLYSQYKGVPSPPRGYFIAMTWQSVKITRDARLSDRDFCKSSWSMYKITDIWHVIEFARIYLGCVRLTLFRNKNIIIPDYSRIAIPSVCQ